LHFVVIVIPFPMSEESNSSSAERRELAGLDVDSQKPLDTSHLSRQVILNVGGTRFETTPLTLIRSKYFQIMFQPPFSEANGDAGMIFIDRDPVLFSHILRWMRNTDYLIPCEAWSELEFFQIDHPYRSVLASGISRDVLQQAIHTVLQDAQIPGRVQDASCTMGTLLDLVSKGMMSKAWSENTTSVYLGNKDRDGVSTVLPLLCQREHAVWTARYLELSSTQSQHMDGLHSSSVSVDGMDMVRAMSLVITVPHGFDVAEGRWTLFQKITLGTWHAKVFSMQVHTLRMLDHLILTAEQRQRRDAQDARHGRLTFRLPCWFDRDRYGPLRDLEPFMYDATTEGYNRAIHLPQESTFDVHWKSSVLPCMLQAEANVLSAKELHDIRVGDHRAWMTDWHQSRGIIQPSQVGPFTMSVSERWSLLMTDFLVAVVDETTDQFVPLSRIEVLYGIDTRRDECTTMLMMDHSYKTGRTFEDGVYWLCNRPGYSNMHRVGPVRIRVTFAEAPNANHRYSLIASAQQINMYRWREHGVDFESSEAV
jgi:hypothetical protein